MSIGAVTGKHDLSHYQKVYAIHLHSDLYTTSAQSKLLHSKQAVALRANRYIQSGSFGQRLFVKLPSYLKHVTACFVLASNDLSAYHREQE